MTLLKLNNSMIRNIVNKYMHFIFPFAYSLNMFSMTMLLILLGLMGEAETAADVAIVQAATLVVFMAFGANARNIILGNDNNISIAQILKFRYYLLLPLAVLSFLLSKSFIELDSFIVIGLIMRRSFEWIAELNISCNEKENNKNYAYSYSLIQIITFLTLAITILFGKNNFISISLFVWAISPAYKMVSFSRRSFSKSNFSYFTWRSFLPHLGSSWIISISMYVFRILIILLAGKSIAGMMFSAYAIGGMISSVYAYALGPSLAIGTYINSKANLVNKTNAVLLVLFLIGSGISIFALQNDSFTQMTRNYNLAIGLSLIGSAIMFLAQKKRIHLLQLYNVDVFVPDVIANILIISIVPFAFYIIGENVFPYLFLINSILSLFIFAIYNPSIEKDNYTRNVTAKSISRVATQSIVLILIIAPVFFQISRLGVFNDSAMNYYHGGSISNLPLPFSIIGCAIGMLFLVNYKKCHVPAIFLFSLFLLMMVSIFFGHTILEGNIRDRIIFLIQFILPVFALFLGASYIAPENKALSFQAIFFYTIALVIPMQVMATLYQATGILTPDLYIFSIYQHLQYVPALLLLIFFMGLLTLKDMKSIRLIALMMSPFIATYSVLSFSSLSLLIFIVGTLSSLFILLFDKKVIFACSLFVFLAVSFITALNLEKFNIYEYELYHTNYIQQKNAALTNKKIYSLLKRFSDPNLKQYLENLKLAADAFEKGEFDLSFAKFNYLAKTLNVNSPFVDYYLGLHYYDGLAVTENKEKGLGMIVSAADAGVPVAQLYLGEIYALGINVMKDSSTARKWYSRVLENKKTDLTTKYMVRKKYNNLEGDSSKIIKYLDDADEMKIAIQVESEEIKYNNRILDVSKRIPDANYSGRMFIWRYYIENILDSIDVFLFGHAERYKPDLSAHNYYLDIVYNFGFIALLPFLTLFGYSFYGIYKVGFNNMSFSLVLLIISLIFILLVDNFFKVGMRQPYSGIITFFLWGVFLSKVTSAHDKHE